MNIAFKKEKCVGCEICALVCNYKQVRVTGLEESNIKIFRNYPELADPLFTSNVCLQCENAKCVDACNQGALTKNEEMVVLDKQKCTGSGSCIEACPFNAIWISRKDEKAHKCDLCQGSPECVEFCPHDALELKR